MSGTTEKLITINDDFTDALSDVPALLAEHAPFAVFVQEGKRTRYWRVLRRIRRKRHNAGDQLRYRQVQLTRTDHQAGLAIVWDAVTAPLVSGPYYRVLVEPDGAAMLKRGVLWIVVDHPSLGAVVLATTHRPPWRFRHLWPAYDEALRKWAAGRGAALLLVGIDVNTRRLAAFASRVGLTVAGKGIDAVLARGLQLRKPRRLKRRHSDHRPVAVNATGEDTTR